MVEGKDTSKLDAVIKSTENYLNTFIETQEFNSAVEGNAMIRMDNSFEGLCFALEDAGVNEPLSMTVYQFYFRVQTLAARARAQNAHS